MSDAEINNIKIMMAKFEQKLDDIASTIIEIKDRLDRNESKYAGKWVEKLTIALIVAIIGLVVKMIMR